MPEPRHVEAFVGHCATCAGALLERCIAGTDLPHPYLAAMLAKTTEVVALHWSGVCRASPRFAIDLLGAVHAQLARVPHMSVEAATRVLLPQSQLLDSLELGDAEAGAGAGVADDDDDDDDEGDDVSMSGTGRTVADTSAAHPGASDSPARALLALLPRATHIIAHALTKLATDPHDLALALLHGGLSNCGHALLVPLAGVARLYPSVVDLTDCDAVHSVWQTLLEEHAASADTLMLDLLVLLQGVSNEHLQTWAWCRDTLSMCTRAPHDCQFPWTQTPLSAAVCVYLAGRFSAHAQSTMLARWAVQLTQPCGAPPPPGCGWKPKKAVALVMAALEKLFIHLLRDCGRPERGSHVIDPIATAVGHRTLRQTQTELSAPPAARHDA